MCSIYQSNFYKHSLRDGHVTPPFVLIFFEHGYLSDYCTNSFDFSRIILHIYTEVTVSQILFISSSFYFYEM